MGISIDDEITVAISKESVKEIVQKLLREKGYSGLCSPGFCPELNGCPSSHICECFSPDKMMCVPAYRHLCVCGEEFFTTEKESKEITKCFDCRKTTAYPR